MLKIKRVEKVAKLDEGVLSDAIIERLYASKVINRSTYVKSKKSSELYIKQLRREESNER